ncbi:MAG: hypothetical protein IJ767_03850 [Bacteroidaceae bacterium]|nr:hypothetical protein [Bacteroidaceae bacterium]
MKKREAFPVCWVRFSAYMHPWITAIFGTSMQFDGQSIVDLFPVRGVEELMQQPFIYNSEAKVLNKYCCSDQLMRMIHAAQICSQDIADEEFGMSKEETDTFLPVAMPEVVKASGLNREWNSTVQMSGTQAAKLSTLVADEFWRSMYRFSIHFRTRCGLEEQNYSVQKMVEAFIESYKIDSRYQDQLVRVFYRKMAKKTFNEC